MVIEPVNFSRSQIEYIAQKFAELTNFTPCVTDIYKYVESLGGTFNYSDEKIDENGGSIDVVGPKEFTINLSKNTSAKRDVFTIAHELGHFVLHSKLGLIQLKAGRDENIDTAEREANSFAAAFLMPAELVKSKHHDLSGNLYSLADAFNVSLSAITWRCKNLGL